MNKISVAGLAIIALLLGGVLPLAVAQDIQPLQSEQGIRYISGGVGLDERTEFEAMSSQFNLRLLFARQGSGEYMASVQVNIQDAHGKAIFTAESNGPWLFAQLPAGNYVVEVTAAPEVQQRSQRKSVRLGDARQSRLNFYWR